MKATQALTEQIAGRYTGTLHELASMPFQRVGSKQEQSELLACSFGQAVGASFFLAFHRSDTSQNTSVESSVSPGLFYEALTSQATLPYRAPPFRSVFLGQGKCYRKGAVCEAMAEGAGIRANGQSALSLVSPFLDTLHAMYARSAICSVEELCLALKRVQSYRHIGHPEKALPFCHSILLSRCFLKDTVTLEGKDRKTFYFDFLGESIQVANDARENIHAAVWMELRLGNDKWSQLPLSAKNQDWQLAGKILRDLAADQPRIDSHERNAMDRRHLRRDLINASEMAGVLWNTVAQTGLFDAQDVGLAQQACLEGKESWRELNLQQEGISAPQSWSHVGLAETQKSDVFCGLSVISKSEWLLQDFSPLEPLLTSFYRSLVRHALGESDAVGFMQHCVLAGTPGVAKTSFAQAMGIAALQEAHRRNAERSIVVVQFPAGFGLSPNFSRSADFTKQKLDELNQRAKQENLTILVLADEIELLFNEDTGQSSAAIENGRANQVWYNWLDSSRKDSHLFFFFTMNEMGRLPRPIRSRLNDFTVHWSQAKPLVLRQLLRRSKLNAPLQRQTIEPWSDAKRQENASSFGPRFVSDEETPSVGHASDALVACRPLMPLRSAKAMLDVQREELFTEKQEDLTRPLRSLIMRSRLESHRFSHLGACGSNGESFAIELNLSRQPAKKSLFSGVMPLEWPLGQMHVKGLSFVASSTEQDVIVRILMPPEQQPAVTGFQLHFHRWWVTSLLPLRTSNNADADLRWMRDLRSSGVELVLKGVWKRQLLPCDAFLFLLVTPINACQPPKPVDPHKIARDLLWRKQKALQGDDIGLVNRAAARWFQTERSIQTFQF